MDAGADRGACQTAMGSRWVRPSRLARSRRLPPRTKRLDARPAESCQHPPNRTSSNSQADVDQAPSARVTWLVSSGGSLSTQCE